MRFETAHTEPLRRTERKGWWVPEIFHESALELPRMAFQRAAVIVITTSAGGVYQLPSKSLDRTMRERIGNRPGFFYLHSQPDPL